MEELSLKGFRLLALGHKVLTEEEAKKDITELEKDIVFVGFLVFQNKIKDQTRKIISNLKRGHINPLIITGDGAFVTINVAITTGVIPPKDDIILAFKGKDTIKFNYYSNQQINKKLGASDQG